LEFPTTFLSFKILKCFVKNSAFEYPWDGSESTPTALDDKGNVIIGTASELAYVIKNGGALITF
jgi:hypothetical protein